MNIFEDLVEELKEENLLEETVIELNQEKPAEIAPADFIVSTPEKEDLNEVLSEFKDVLDSDIEVPAPVFSEAAKESGLPEEFPTASAETIIQESETDKNLEFPIASAPTNEAEFYTKRAMDEVSGLQLVEHVFSGVEREQMKVVPKPYDDLECKKALHAFMQVSEDLNSPEHAKAEFRLMQETESWYSALSRRDRNISVTHLRRYCETTRPILSSTALISLARFYRNAPFSEMVRSKFDLILTRLLTKEIKNDKRELPLTREEIIGHLTTLYGQWASIPLYSANEDESEILLISLKFEEFMKEAENAENFDELINNDFFNRLRSFKESTHENFFAPLVTATAVECNVRVGNRYVDLIRAEKQKFDAGILEDKYGFLHDQAISESSSKTLQLVQLLQEKIVDEEPELPQSPAAPETPQKTARKERKTKSQITTAEEMPSRYKVNKWLLAATILIVVVNIGLYVWMSMKKEPELSNQKVEKVNLDNSSLRDFIKDARIANNTFFGVVQANWTNLDKEKQEEILKKIYSTSKDKGFSKAHLLNSTGRTVGYIDSTGLQLY